MPPPGRYLLDLAEALGGDDLQIGAATSTWTRWCRVVRTRGQNVTYTSHHALDPAQLAQIAPADVIVISGLYEILTDEPKIRTSLRRLALD